MNRRLGPAGLRRGFRGWRMPMSGAPAVTPGTIFGADLIGWYESDSGMTTTGWVDQSSHGNDLASGGAVDPTVTTLFDGSTPALDFGNAGTYFSNDTPSGTLPTDARGITVATVMYYPTGNPWVCAFANTGGTRNNGANLLLAFGDARFRCGSLTAGDAISALATNTDAVVIGINAAGGGSREIRVNGGSASTATSIATDFQRITLGNSNDRVLAGAVIAGHYIVNRAATTSERAAFEVYLSGRWGTF